MNTTDNTHASVPEEQVNVQQNVEDTKVTNPETEKPAEENPVTAEKVENHESEPAVTAIPALGAEEKITEVYPEHSATSGEIAEEPVSEKSVSEAASEAASTTVETAEPAVDFSDEDAALAADAPEYELGEHVAEVDDQADTTPTGTSDFSGMNKTELIAAFEELLATKPVQNIRRDVEAIKIAFYKNYRAEVDQVRKMYIESGGNPDDFVPPTDDKEQRLKALFVEYREKRNHYIANLDSEKEANYKIKLGIIDELKQLIESSETLNHTFNAFRELQQRWKETGPVPQTHLKDLWETYNLHVENFYNFIKINKELRDLDLKKNYEAKLALCEDAETLLLEPSVITAFHKLQKLHEDWRETGPVANESKEQLWERFREASSKINKRHQEYFENLKEEQKRNLDLKTELCVKTEELVELPLSTRKEWNKASDQLIEIQKVWKTIGFAPKKENTKVYERFRNACDKFFENKRNFYLQNKLEMENNLLLKTEICTAAEALKDSEDWKKTTDELIALQKQWKEVGPVSRRHSDAIWKRFRAACDAFFERKSKHFSSVDSQYQENLEKKQAILEEIANFTFETRDQGFEGIKAIQRRWSEIGFVPIKQKDEVQSQYRKAVDEVFAKLRGSDREQRMERFKSKLSNNRQDGGGDRKLRFERDRLYNKMKQLENDIALLENNIGFFSKSKNAEAMIRDVNEKIARNKEELATVIEKINLIDKQGE